MQSIGLENVIHDLIMDLVQSLSPLDLVTRRVVDLNEIQSLRGLHARHLLEHIEHSVSRIIRIMIDEPLGSSISKVVDDGHRSTHAALDRSHDEVATDRL